VIRDGKYIVPDAIWKDVEGNAYAVHVLGCGLATSGPLVMIEFEDEDGPRVECVPPTQLEMLR
jgi:hypothetical protein